MILFNLSDSKRIESLNPLFVRLFDYLRNNDLLHLPLGKIVIDEENLYINNVNPMCISKEEQLLEVHKRYIDVHILLCGKEKIGWKSTDSLSDEVQGYNESSECALFKDKPTAYIDVLPYQCVIVYPEDAHAPIIGTGKIRKMIAKVKI